MNECLSCSDCHTTTYRGKINRVYCHHPAICAESAFGACLAGWTKSTKAPDWCPLKREENQNPRDKEAL